MLDERGVEVARVRRPCRFARKLLRLSHYGDAGIGWAPPLGAEVDR